jgi:hypothetical protein
LQQIGDPLDTDIGYWIIRENFLIDRVATLPNENRRHTRCPEFFDRGQDPDFVVNDP